MSGNSARTASVSPSGMVSGTLMMIVMTDLPSTAP
jgi:hypothetical protein